MKFIVDAQLPEGLKFWLIEQGHDVIHTDDLPNKHLTKDTEIIEIAEKENRIVISKDNDFYKHHLINGTPKKILFLKTGNIVNKELLRLFELNFQTIEKHFIYGSCIIEFNNTSIIVYS
jgi:predicted nuclease of predicted toxin-antitoxin system